MSDPFIGQILAFAGNFAPRGWALCQGQLLSISQNAALFSIIGTTYGGNGTTNFGLPDLRGRKIVGAGSGPGLATYVEGQQGGTEQVSLTISQLPSHNHLVTGQAISGNAGTPSNAFVAQVGAGKSAVDDYSTATSNPVTMAPTMIQPTGGSQPFPTLDPYLAVNYIIALQGIFPSRN